MKWRVYQISKMQKNKINPNQFKHCYKEKLVSPDSLNRNLNLIKKNMLCKCKEDLMISSDNKGVWYRNCKEGKRIKNKNNIRLVWYCQDSKNT